MVKKATPYTDAYRRKVFEKRKQKDIFKIAKQRNNIIESIGHKSGEFVCEVGKALKTKKARRIEHYVVIFIYVAVILVAGYFLLVNTNPEILPDDFYIYEISASDSLIDSNLRSLYLGDIDVLGGVGEVYNESMRLIVSEKPFSFIFNPRRKIRENTSASVKLLLAGYGTEVYLNEKLIVPDLDGFEKVADFNDSEVWAKAGLRTAVGALGYKMYNSSEDFIYANFPGKNIYSFKEMNGGAPIIVDYKDSSTFIKTRFRDNLKLAVYAEGDLEIDFIKQDLNWYLGKDEYTIEIKDLQGNSYFKKVYGDDGNKKTGGDGEFEQKVSLTGKDLPRNIYYISFTKDENNKASDSTIKNIRINSNKVLIVGRILPLDEFKFYTEINSVEKIGFNYWHNGKEQEIIVNGTKNFVIDLNESWKGKKYEEEFGDGEYSLEVPKGDVWIYSSLISPSKSHWFCLPRKGDKKLINQDIIVIDKNKLMIDGKKVAWKGIIDVEDGSKIKIQVLDKLEVYFRKIKLVL